MGETIKKFKLDELDKLNKEIKRVKKFKWMGVEMPLDKGANEIYLIVRDGELAKNEEEEPFFFDKKIRERNIKNLFSVLNEEKRRWIKSACRFKLKDLKGKSLKEKIHYIISIPLDWLFFQHYFGLLKSTSKTIIINLCDLKLKKEVFECQLKNLKQKIKELKFLDGVFKHYCQLDFCYFEQVFDIIDRKILQKGVKEETKERLEKIREIIFFT